MIRILFIGDIVGRPGRGIVQQEVARLRAKHDLTFVIANGENAAAGAGITGTICRSLVEAGVDAITLGDHVWDQKDFAGEIGGLTQVCRPANLPAACPGRPHLILEHRGFRLAIATVLGRQFMGLKAECPFAAADRLLAETVAAGAADALFVEIHAEATSEKIALGWHLDGRALAVVGTHTHVPTADASVLPKGTAYCTDAGMTGPYAGVLGREVGAVVAKFLDGMPRRFEVAEGDVRLSGVLVEWEPISRRAARCELLTVRAS